MKRRGFLKGMAGILASGFAPALLPSGILMPVRKLILPEISGFSLMPPGPTLLDAWMDWADAEAQRISSLTPDMIATMQREYPWASRRALQRILATDIQP